MDVILTEKPDVEFVQIQLNYVDFNDQGIQSAKCLEVCRKHQKPVIVMEPVKGGSLVNLPEEADKVLQNLKGGSNASYAVRFAASQKDVYLVLSGMSTLAQMKDNINYMKDFMPLNKSEYEAIGKVVSIMMSKHLIPCTGCKYCVDGCPKNILIPNLFADMNAKIEYNNWNSDYYYEEVHTNGHGKASECIKCDECEKACPQHLKIRRLLVDVAKTFEKK